MERGQKAQSRHGKLVAHQTSELGALRKRIQTTREELKKQRQAELERCICSILLLDVANLCRLLQRFQNVKSELEAQQHMERQRALKYEEAFIIVSAYLA